MKRIRSDLIIENGTVLTVDENDSIIERGAIAISDGKIVGVDREDAINGKFSAAKRLDAKGGIIMPGLINTHTHLAMSLLRGIADDVSLDSWLKNYIFPLEEQFMNKDSVYVGSLLSCAEMALSGTTTFCDMYFFEKEVGRAAEKIGMRAVIGEGIVASGKNEEQIWQKKKELTTELMKKFNRSELISIGVKPHSPYTCSRKILQEAKKFSKENGLLYVIHLAETEKEFSDFKKSAEMTPTQYLEKLDVLDNSTLAAHCVWMEDGDLDIFKKHEVKISHCPQSNMKLGSGVAPIVKFLREGIVVSLGTDGAASNNTLDMFSEMKTAALLAKVNNHEPQAFSAKEAVRMATIKGAEALRKENEIGSLEVDKKADVIVVGLDKPHLTPIYDYYSHLVYCANGSDVKTSIVNGGVVMSDRKIKNADLADIIKKANFIATKIKKGAPARTT
ncbi:MAG: amidohydrolase [Candidatus Pacebacteria bacterium]|nr:amidohydrolase [Candidatus Paceibacterota bacterium]